MSSRSSLLNLEIFDLVIIFIIIFVVLLVGMWGYSTLACFSPIDSFLNASMILGGMGPVDTIVYPEGKIFAGLYALFCGLIIISIIAYIIARILALTKPGI